MGHGASTSVKKVTLIKEVDEDPSDTRPVWTRSNSDGCIVENLNSSKTKVDLLGQQVDEYKELLKAVESKYEEAVDRADTLEKQLAEVEGVNFDLTDTVSDLQQQLESIQANAGPEVNKQLEEELTISNQQVEKLEMHIKVLEEQMASMRSKFRKKLRAANTEVTEAKQESSLKLYSLKDQIKQLEEDNLKLQERLDMAQSRSSEREQTAIKTDGEDSRMMVILELSNQVSAQEDQIIQLQGQLEERDKTIEELNQQVQRERPPSRPVSEVGSRPPSGATNRPVSGRSSQRSSRDGQLESSHPRKGSGKSVRSVDSLDRIQDGKGHIQDHQEIKEKHASEFSLTGYDDYHVDQTITERTASGRSGSKTHTSSCERTKSGSLKNRTQHEDANIKKSLERTSSAESKEGSRRRNRSSSRGKRKDTVESSTDSFELQTNQKVAEDNSNIPARVNSAGSHDSAFHEGNEEGRTKSAPCGAGTSRHRQRLKAAQQRASSLETIDHSSSSSPKPPLRADSNLYERDSGVGNELDNVSSRSAKASDQDLDDLLQEIMSDTSPTGSGLKKKNAKSNHGHGISEQKIRSLLSSDGKT